MVKLPHEPINTATTKCKIVIFGTERTILKIGSRCWKRNEEFRTSKKPKIKENLSQWLLDEKVIKNLVQQINEKELVRELNK